MRFDAVTEALLKGGIAPRHVRRYVRELDDHLDDLIRRQQKELEELQKIREVEESEHEHGG